MCAKRGLVTLYLEGDTSQSERLEISLRSLHGTQDESLFAGTDVVLPVAVERTHTEGQRGEEILYRES